MSKFIKLALKTTDLEQNQLTFRGRPYMSYYIFFNIAKLILQYMGDEMDAQ